MLFRTVRTGEGLLIEMSYLKTRFAYIEDLPIVFELCNIGLQELSSQLVLKISPEKLLHSIHENWAKAPCILLIKGSEIIGFYGLTAYTPYYSDDAILGDYMLYIKPEHRTYKAAKMLCTAARAFADHAKIALDLNFVTPGDIKTKSRFLENMGARITGVKAVYDGR